MSETFHKFLLEGERAGMRYALAVPRATVANSIGMQLGQRAGSSLEFREHRDYQPGDDLRRIDWNHFARADKLTVKLYREESSPHLDIVLDGSRSMALMGSAKSQAAVGLSAALAVAAANAGYSHLAWLAGAACAPVANSENRPPAWAGINFDFSGHPSESFARVPPRLRRQGQRALISDLLWLGEPLAILQPLAQSAAAVTVVQVLAAADVNPPERGRIRLVDAETDERREIVIDEAAIARYRAALARHQQHWQRACRQVGATMINVVAEEIVVDWNLAALVKAEVLKV